VRRSGSEAEVQEANAAIRSRSWEVRKPAQLGTGGRNVTDWVWK
jgi:hypothetical protein